MLRRALLALLPSLAILGSAVASVGCGPPASARVTEEDPQLLQEVIRRQEQRVAQAKAEVANLERELRMVQMRRRMLERAGRRDLAAALEFEERSLVQRLAGAQRAVADEEDALAIYRTQGG